MNNTTESAVTKDQAAKPQPKAKAPKAKISPVPKPAKQAKAGDDEPADRLPTIVEDLKTVFELGDALAVKIVRRITGRARFFQRAVELTTKKA